MRLLALATAVRCVAATRSVSWWFECGNNASIDAANVAALAKLKPSAVTRVMPDFDFVKGEEDWWWPLIQQFADGDVHLKEGASVDV